MKKALIITYYWPPSGGSGVQRWLKFAKYLPENGWQPIVYTVENGEYPVNDESLSKDIPKEAIVLKQPIWEPYSYYKKLLGKKKNDKFGHAFIGETPKKGLKKFLYNFSIWVRGNFFIPDARKFWIKPSVKYLTDYLATNKVDVIITSGPPHSVHLIGKKLAETLNIKWISDFRDPWTEIYYFDDLKIGALAKAKHKRLEKGVLLSSDGVICIGENMKLNLAKLLAEQDITKKIKVITNGYDELDNHAENIVMDEKFTITHVGVFNKKQNHISIWDGISEAMATLPDLKGQLELQLIGNIDPVVVAELTSRNIPYKIINYIPHKEVIELEKRSQLLLLSLSTSKNAKELISGKIFEYLLSARPILCVGPPDGDAAIIIKDANSGITCDYNDTKGIKNAVLEYYHRYKNGQLKIDQKNIEKYSRKSLTKDLAIYLESLI